MSAVRGGSVVLVALLLGLFPTNARAQGVDEFGRYGPRKENYFGESPQHVAVEIRVGRYKPSIDDEFASSAPYPPYQTMFGDDNRYSIGLEVDWQAIRIPYLGTFGPGFGISYTKITANSFLT